MIYRFWHLLLNVDDIFATDNIFKIDSLDPDQWEEVLKINKNRNYFNNNLNKFSVQEQAKNIEIIII